MQPGTGAVTWAPVVNRNGDVGGSRPRAATWAAPAQTQPDEEQDAIFEQYVNEASEVLSPEQSGMLVNLERKPMPELLDILAGKKALRAQLHAELALLRQPSGLEQRVNQLEDALKEVRDNTIASLVSTESPMVKTFMEAMREDEHGRAMDEHYGGHEGKKVKVEDRNPTDLMKRLDDMLAQRQDENLCGSCGVRHEAGETVCKSCGHNLYIAKKKEVQTDAQKAEEALVHRLRDALARYRNQSRRSQRLEVEMQQAREDLTGPLHRMLALGASHNPLHGSLATMLNKLASKFQNLQIEQIRVEHQLRQAQADLREIQPEFAALQETRQARKSEQSQEALKARDAIRQWVDAHPKASSREVLAQIEIIEGKQNAGAPSDFLQKPAEAFVFADAYTYQSGQAGSQILPSLAGGADLPGDQQTMELLSQLSSSPNSVRILSQLQSSQATGQTLPLLRQLQEQLQTSEDGRQVLPVVRDLLSHLQGNTYIDNARVGRVEEALAQQMSQAGAETFLAPPVTLARVEEMQRRAEIQMKQQSVKAN